MKSALDRRRALLTLGAWGLLTRAGLATPLPADAGATTSLIGASWRGPKAGDAHYAGVLAADWERKALTIQYAVALPTRPHGLLPEADGGLLVNSVRPGEWLLRCDGRGKVVQRLDVGDESRSVRLSGHAVAAGGQLFTTEIDYRTDQGRIGVRDRRTLKKIDEWASGGIEPHQALLDDTGALLVANGGLRRTLADHKHSLADMDSSLVRLDGRSGRQLGRWALDDRRLSLRHLAWSEPTRGEKPLLGIAMQAEHDAAAQRAAAPTLAVFDGDTLRTPTRDNDGHGYAGDIGPAYNGGFALSSNKAGLAQVWHPGEPDKLSPIVELQEAYALAGWSGPAPGGGVLVATAFGLVRWHIAAPPVLLRWPMPMALDNHWVLMS